MRIALLVLVLLSGCATATITRPDGTVLRARVLGAGLAQSGDCTVQAVDLATPSADGKATAENRTLVGSGRDCAMAEGGRGSNGLWATVAAGFAALLTLATIAF